MENRHKPTLRELLASGRQLMAPCAYDCLTAKALEVAGFDAILLSGGAMGYIFGAMTEESVFIDEMAKLTENMADTVSIPIIVDAGDGHGEMASEVQRNIRRLALAGAAAVTIDDGHGWFVDEPIPFKGNDGTRGPKDLNRIMSPFAFGPAISDRIRGFRPVLERKEFLEKIEAAVRACEGTDCMVISRVEAYDVWGFDEVIARIEESFALGAEMATVCLGMWWEQDARMFAEALPGRWLMWPDITSHEGESNVDPALLHELGFNLVTFHIAEKAVMYGMEKFGTEIIESLNTQSVQQIEIPGLTREQEQDLLGMDLRSIVEFEQRLR